MAKSIESTRGNLMNIKKVYIFLFLIIILLILIFMVKKNDAIDENKWYINNKLIGHALYGIDNQDYTNSYEALRLGYNKGIKVFEADFLFTSDNRLVLNHYWEDGKILSYDQYMSRKINNRYTPMDIEDLLLYMKENKDVYIVVDTKQDEYDKTKFLNIYSKIVEQCNNIDSTLLDRFIIQIYQYEDLNKIKEIYNFKDYIFTLYKLPELSIIKLITFCKFNDINTIVVPKEYIEYNILKAQDIKIIKTCGLKIYSHTINDNNTYRNLINYDIDGIYTDFIY